MHAEPVERARLLVVLRLAIPLAVYADKGSKLPAIPTFVRPAAAGGLSGDATGFYAGLREFIAAWGRIALGIVVVRHRRAALPYLAGALAFAPVVLVYWPKSYPKLYGNANSWPRDAFDVHHVVSSWTHSSIFTPHTLAIVVPLAVIGAFGLSRPWTLALVLAFLLVNPVF